MFEEEKAKILVVEDNQETRSKLLNLLSEMPEIKLIGTAENGMSAIEMINRLKPDIVLLDIVMPQLDGFGVMEYLYEHNIFTKVIVVSALAHENFIQRALSLGAKYYVAKPFNNEILKERILNVIVQLKAPEIIPMRKEHPSPPTLDEKISSLFISIGIPAHIKGYQFLREAVKMVVENPDSINRITKELYPSIAKKFSTSSSKVERAIRHAIEVAWTRGKIENINALFGFVVYGKNDKPTNGEFIALIADKLTLEYVQLRKA